MAGRMERDMIQLAVFFFILSVIAGLCGFTRIAGAASRIARVLFFVLFAVFLILLAFALALGSLLQ
jgi:uncharacterized membrane protein YtjA (UPF0391 family)